MLELNKLFLHAYVNVNKFLQQNNVNYYPSSIGVGYRELFNRDTFACLSFYDKSNKQYYLYFNAAYDRDINKMVFTSISIVSRDNLNLKNATYENKTHIETMDDIQTFLSVLKGMI